MTTKNYTLEVDDDGAMTLPDELLEITGWKEGTTLEYIDNGDGSVTVKEVVEQTEENDD